MLRDILCRVTATAHPAPYEDLGRRIRRARERKGLSQENFAPVVGVTRRHLIRIEKGRHWPGGPLLARIADATGTTVGELAGGTTQEAALSGDPFRRPARHEAGRSPNAARPTEGGGMTAEEVT
jgi:transcriptional regulator with XRE-family HTH domain